MESPSITLWVTGVNIAECRITISHTAMTGCVDSDGIYKLVMVYMIGSNAALLSRSDRENHGGSVCARARVCVCLHMSVCVCKCVSVCVFMCA